MDNRTKKRIYWGGFAVTLAAGCAASLFRLLPVQNTAVFLFGLLWLWDGITLILKINLYYAQDYNQKIRVVFSAIAICLGAAWGAISLSPLSREGLPMLLVSLPFVALSGFLFLRHKNN